MRKLHQFELAVIRALLAVFCLTQVATSTVYADAFSSSGTGSAGDSKVEEDYNFDWLDPDKKVYVLQNRKYLKGGHPMISIMGTTGFSNPYRSTLGVDPRLTYYANETWGLEVFYSLVSNTPNSTDQALKVAAANTLPSIREIRAQYGATVHYVPWYAKINVFNAILYFDWYFAAGLGSLDTFVDTRTRVSLPSNFVQQTLTGVFFNTGHLYHLSQNLVFRLDFAGSAYNAPIRGTSGEAAWYSNYTFGVGLGWRV